MQKEIYINKKISFKMALKEYFMYVCVNLFLPNEVIFFLKKWDDLIVYFIFFINFC